MVETRPSAKTILLSFAVASLCLATLPLLGSASAATQATVNVAITNSGFNPATMTIVIGVNNTVTWTNTLSSTQNVVPDLSDPNQNWGTLALSAGQSYTYAFATPGTYGYNDGYSQFIGTIYVLPNPNAATSSSTAQATSSSSATLPATVTPTSETSMPQTTSSASGGGVPEFPFAGAAVALVTALVVASYLLTRQTKAGGRSGTR